MVSLGTQMDFVGNSLKLFRIISVMIIQTKCKLNNAELFLKLHSNYIRSKGIGNRKYYEETRELER